MKPLDNKIKYYELLMKYDNTSIFKKYELPDDFHFEYYKPGDELEWVNIHIESGEFTSIKQGLEWFHTFYDSFIEELNERCIFIVDNTTNEKIGTATVSLLKEKEYGYDAAIDWVAIKKQYQGRKLSKPLISKFIEIASKLGHKKIILHTQTTTWLAAKIYLDYGFEILNSEEEIGWSILKTITNHEKLLNYKTLENKEIYDERNIEIENQLKKVYNTEDFNYSVWYKNGLHNVYTYCNGISREYEYYIENDKLLLKEIKQKEEV